MSEGEYRSLPALNASRFKAFFRSPYHFANQKEVETTEAMRIGTAIHTAMLQPEDYLKTIAYYPDVDGRTKEGKAIKQAFDAGAVGKTILKADSEAVVLRAIHAIKSNSDWQKMNSDSIRKEIVLLGKLAGIDCKARLDIIDVENGIIRDIKSCDDVSGTKFKYTVKDRMYWVQAAFYCLLAEECYGKPFRFEFIAVETSEPSTCAFWEVAPEELVKWKNAVLMGLFDYVDCKHSDFWQGPQGGVLGELNINYGSL
jgi:exodeoxyribonuclease VIII